MALEFVPDALGDPRNARACAMACELAYIRDPAEGAKAFKEQLWLDAKLISVDNTQAYVGANEGAIVVAFRGSEAPTSINGLKDWLLTNAVNLLIVPEGQLGTDFIAAGVGARFHKGFMGALAAIWEPLAAEVDRLTKESERPLWVTGHSLGGALAQLAAWRFNRRFMQVHQVYTYGSPMIGNAATKAAFDKEFAGRIFRYANVTDLVPRLPTISLIANEYCHCDKEMSVGQGEAAHDTLKGFASKAADGILKASIMDEIWAVVQTRLAAHDITNYRNLIK